MSGPNFSGPPPIVGGAGGYGGNNNFSPPAAAPPPIAPSPASIGQTIKAPIIDSKIAVALYDYEASNNEELTIRENDNLIVLDDSDPEWTLVKIVSKKGGEGLVPASYIQVKPRLGEEDNLNSDNAPGSAPDSPPTFKVKKIQSK